MCDLIVMTFEDSADINQIRYVMRQAQESSIHNFDATIVTKDGEGTLRLYPLKEVDPQGRAQPTSSPIALPENVPDKAHLQEVLDSLPLDGAALFVLVDDDDSSTALLTILMLLSPRAMSLFLPLGMKKNDKADTHFYADLETYQAAVANLEFLGSDSTEGEVEVVFKAVDEAYDRLVRLIYAAPETEDA